VVPDQAAASWIFRVSAGTSPMLTHIQRDLTTMVGLVGHMVLEPGEAASAVGVSSIWTSPAYSAMKSGKPCRVKSPSSRASSPTAMSPDYRMWCKTSATVRDLSVGRQR
jgi:hypothetical protein